MPGLEDERRGPAPKPAGPVASPIAVRSRWSPRRLPTIRLSVSGKFVAALVAVVIATLALGGVGLVGLQRTHDDAGTLLAHDQHMLAQVGLMTSLDGVGRSALEQTAGVGPDETIRLNLQLDKVQIPGVLRSLATLRQDDVGGTITDELDELDDKFADYLALRRNGAYERASIDEGGYLSNALASQTAALFDAMTRQVESMFATQAQETLSAQNDANATYRSSRAMLITSAAALLLISLLLVLVLIRDLVPRIRAYSHFATEIAASRPVRDLDPRGQDELSELGRALNAMVSNVERANLSEEIQTEFVETLQVTSTEDEAHELVQRHLERSLPDSEVLVLKRNNSANRLLAATPVDPATPLGARLDGAEPRSCLALRFGRTHHEGGGRPPLLSCTLCAPETGERTTCQPLLVGGEVIGAVLVKHTAPLDDAQSTRIRTSVVQAAPVLANLRNLALAQFRANNDSLTGLSNKRATDDTLKRMVAQSNRSMTPLTAIMLDLDHFKQINDRHGHGRGDEVLAAVGAVLQSCLRASDFAGRFGGEEFLILLPDTAARDAWIVAETIRLAVAALDVPGVDTPITGSLGFADVGQHPASAERLTRDADRAMYSAKAAGRNCVRGTDEQVLAEVALTIPLADPIGDGAMVLDELV